jgi:hypothetical protein
VNVQQRLRTGQIDSDGYFDFEIAIEFRLKSRLGPMCCAATSRLRYGYDKDRDLPFLRVPDDHRTKGGVGHEDEVSIRVFQADGVFLGGQNWPRPDARKAIPPRGSALCGANRVRPARSLVGTHERSASVLIL